MTRTLFIFLLFADASAPGRAFDPASCGLLRTIAPLGGELYGVAFSPDGRRLAVGCGNGVRLYDTVSWREAGRLEGHPNHVYSVAFAPDGGTLAAGGFEGMIALWDVASGRLVRTLTGHSAYIAALAFSPDRKTLLSGSLDGTARVWGLAEGAEIKSLTAHRAHVGAVAFSPDGKRAVTAGSDAVVRIWKTDGWEEEKALQGLRGNAVSAAFSRDGKRVLAAADGGGLAAWRLDRGLPERTCDVKVAGHGCLVLTPDERYAVSAQGESVIRVWDTMRRGAEVATLAHHSSPVSGLAVHPAGRLFVSVGQDRHLKVWGRVPGGIARVRGKGFCGIRVQQNAAGSVVIAEVIGATPAHEAGLKVGDALRKVGGVAIANTTESVDKIGSYFEGEEVDFEIERGGEVRTLRIKLGKRPAELDR